MTVTLNKMKKICAQIGLVLLLTTALRVFPTWAQSDEELNLSLRRNFGYSSGTGKIQGTFTMKVAGPEAVDRVVFIIDGEAVGEGNISPFNLQFHTGDCPLALRT